MSRFVYEKLTEHQLRMGLALLNQEGAVVEALEDAANGAVEEALAQALKPFGVNPQIGAAVRTDSGAHGGARAETTKSRPPARRNTGSAKRVQRPGRVKGATITAGQLESRQLQGRYLAAIRSVPKSKRAKYKALVGGAGGRQGAVDAIYRDHPRKDA